jgi:uncharacterized repeat protein (TIGR01451 family)
MFLKRLFLLLSSLFFLNFVQGQVWKWIKNGPGQNFANIKGAAISLDRFMNHIIITGTDSSSYGMGGPPVSFYVSKYDQLGNLLWQREFKGTKHAYDIESDSNGNIYFLSEKFSSIDNQNVSIATPFCLVKLDPNGKLTWISTISAVNRDKIFEFSDHKPIIEIDKNDNLFFGASIYTGSFRFLDSLYSFPAGSSGDIFIARFDTDGKVKWSKRLIVGGDFNYTGGVFDLDINNTGKIAVAGFFEASLNIEGQVLKGVSGTSNPLGRTPFLTVLNTATGNMYFAKIYKCTYTNNYITGIIMKDDGSVISCARVRGGVFMLQDGTTLWGGTDIFFTGSTGTDNPSFKSLYGDINYHSLDFDNDAAGNIYASCAVMWANNGNTSDSFNIRIQKYDSAGNFLYHSTIDLLNKFGTPHAYFKIRDDIVGVTGSVVPRFGNIKIGNNLITGGADSVYTFVGSIIGKNNLVTGRLFYDLNRNGVKDLSEIGLNNRLIATTPGTFGAYTHTNGDYGLYTDTGSFTIKVASIPLYHTVVPPSYPVSFNQYGQREDNKDFALQPIAGIKDLRIDLSPLDIARPGFPLDYFILYSNVGTTVMSGTYSIKLTSDIQIISSDSLPIFNNSDSLAWSFTDLKPGETRRNIIRSRLKATVALGTTFSNYAWIFPVLNDTVPSDNADSINITVRGSFDPNDKLVEPSSSVIFDLAKASKQYLEYMIRFQNTGTDTAFNIRIVDTLSSKLDINTFEVVSSSHKFIINNSAKGVMEFYFPNILLPDSNVNEPSSHGFIKFRIKPFSTVSLSDTIKNDASIYFDYNSPVNTNETVISFRNNIITSTNNLPDYSKYLKVFPNPAGPILFYEFRKTIPDDLKLRVYDIEGRLHLLKSIQNSGTIIRGQISLDILAKGMYFLEISGKKYVARRKFVIL